MAENGSSLADGGPTTLAPRGDGYVGRPFRAAPLAARPAIVFAALAGAALLTRLFSIGDPAFGLDEEFYLVVGDRMWDGALPFVDIWDRKPIGLFLLYALFRPFSAMGIAASQLAAAGFAVATAAVLVRIASRIAPPLASLLAGVVYLAYLPVIGGGTGQSPVFYNLLTAFAALLVVKSGEVGPGEVGTGGRDAARRRGIGAMLLIGLAIQIKYTAFIEGLGFGLLLLWQEWSARRSLAGTARLAVPLVAAALAPTALALAVYVALGHGAAFVQANFLSIFQRHDASGVSRTFLATSLTQLAPLLACALPAAVARLRERPMPPATRLALVWSAFAVADFFAIGNYFNHYALPLLPPLAIVLAPSLRRPLAALAVSAVLLLVDARVVPILAGNARAHRENIAALTEVLAPYARRGCIYVYDGPAILYLTTRSCLPGPYVFPGHLLDAHEAKATRAGAAMARLLDGKPSAIVVADPSPSLFPRNPETAAQLALALASDYRLAARVPYPVNGSRSLIYVRNDLLGGDPR